MLHSLIRKDFCVEYLAGKMHLSVSQLNRRLNALLGLPAGQLIRNLRLRYFGKRSETKDSHDRYANQEVAYLLQRIESFDGIAILASNLKENLDKAFSRRFESIIFFPLPSPEERLRLWQKGFSSKAELAPEVDLPAIARRFELSGGAIMNVIRYASLEALRKGTNVITLSGIQQGVRRELVKEGKVV